MAYVGSHPDYAEEKFCPNELISVMTVKVPGQSRMIHPDPKYRSLKGEDGNQIY